MKMMFQSNGKKALICDSGIGGALTTNTIISFYGKKMIGKQKRK